MTIYGQLLLPVLVTLVVLLDDQRSDSVSTRLVMEASLGCPMDAVVAHVQVTPAAGSVAPNAWQRSVGNPRLTLWFTGLLDFTAHELQTCVLRNS